MLPPDLKFLCESNFACVLLFALLCRLHVICFFTDSLGIIGSTDFCGSASFRCLLICPAEIHILGSCLSCFAL
jgi:hypothetical protein